MRYMGGTVLEKSETTTKKTVPLADVKYTVTVIGRNGRKFKLHRVDGHGPATFYMTFTDRPGMPVLNPHGDAVYKNTYTVFSIDGDRLTADDIVTMRTDDGFEEKLWIVDFTVHGKNGRTPKWRLNGAHGTVQKSIGRPRKVNA
jgi:hypothetical protein